MTVLLIELYYWKAILEAKKQTKPGPGLVQVATTKKVFAEDPLHKSAIASKAGRTDHIHFVP